MKPTTAICAFVLMPVIASTRIRVKETRKAITRVKENPRFPRLRVEGKNMFDHEGNIWIGKGMNWGKHSNMALYNSSDAITMKTLLPWVNHIRVVFKWHTGLGVTYDGYDPTAVENGYLTHAIRNYIHDIVTWATNAEIWVTLTMTYNGGVMHLDDPYKNNTCTPFVTDPIWRQEHQLMWQYLVQKYSLTPYIAFVEPWSEAKMNGCSEQQVSDWMNELVEKIHEVDQAMPVALATDYNQCHGPKHWNRLASDKIIYPINFWCPSEGYAHEMTCSAAWGKSNWLRQCFSGCDADKNAMTTPSKHDYKALIQKALDKMMELGVNAPIWADQWGCDYDKPGTSTWIADFADLFQSYGISSSWWSWKGACKMCVVGPTIDCNDAEAVAANEYRHKNDCKTDLSRFFPQQSLVTAMNSAFMN